MNKYDFIQSKEECHKLTSNALNAVTLVNAMSFMEQIGDRAVEIRMNQGMFSKFVCNAFDIGTKNNIYERSVRTMSFMNARIVIDNDEEDGIVVVNGSKDDGMSVLKIFIEFS